MRLALERAHFFLAHQASLKRKAFHRIIGKRVEVAWFCGAEIPLGFDVKRDRCGHFGSKHILKIHQGNYLMSVVDTLLGEILADIVQHVANVVNQSCHDYLWRFARLLGKVCALQGVLFLRHVGQPIASFGFGIQKGYYLVYTIGHTGTPIEKLYISWLKIEIIDTLGQVNGIVPMAAGRGIAQGKSENEPDEKC